MNYSYLRNRVYTIVERGDKDDKKSLYFDYLIISLVILSVVAIIWESYGEASKQYGEYFRAFEYFSVIVFTIEYLLRLWTAPEKYPDIPSWKAYLKYIFSFIALIDLIAILPFYLPFLGLADLRLLRMMRLLRLLKIFKLNRYSRALILVGKVTSEKREELITTLFFALILLMVSSTLMYYAEHSSNPDNFPNIVATLWWAVVTLTTVGYGDVVPVTTFGKILNGVTALIGIGIVALPTSILSAGFLEKLQERKRQEAAEKEAAQNPESIANLLASQVFRDNTVAYLGENELSNLKCFIDGYVHAKKVHEIDTHELNLEAFYYWLRIHFDREETDANWKYIILEECNNNQELALVKFFELYDQFLQNKKI